MGRLFLTFFILLFLLQSCYVVKNNTDYAFISIEIDRNQKYYIYVDSDYYCKTPIIDKIYILSDSIYNPNDRFDIFIIKKKLK